MKAPSKIDEKETCVIVLSIRLEVSPEKQAAFERAVRVTYPRLLAAHAGSKGYRLARHRTTGDFIGDDPIGRFNYFLDLTFDSVETSHLWIASPEHHSDELAEVIAMADSVAFTVLDVIPLS